MSIQILSNSNTFIFNLEEIASKQRGVTLSSSEAEYVAISESVKEIKFVYYLLKDVGIKVNLPIIVKTDNVSAKCLIRSENLSCQHLVSFCQREFGRQNH
jgi:hypothetical protein